MSETPGGGGMSNGRVDVLRERIDHVLAGQERVKTQLDGIERELRSNFVTRGEFERLADNVVTKDGRYWLVEKLVFGLVALILVATVGALMAQVIR